MSQKVNFGRASLLSALLSIGLPILGKTIYGGMNSPPGPPASDFHPYWPFQLAAILGLLSIPMGIIAFAKKRERISATFGILIGIFWIFFLLALQKILSSM